MTRGLQQLVRSLSYRVKPGVVWGLINFGTVLFWYGVLGFVCVCGGCMNGRMVREFERNSVIRRLGRVVIGIGCDVQLRVCV